MSQTSHLRDVGGRGEEGEQILNGRSHHAHGCQWVNFLCACEQSKGITALVWWASMSKGTLSCIHLSVRNGENSGFEDCGDLRRLQQRNAFVRECHQGQGGGPCAESDSSARCAERGLGRCWWLGAAAAVHEGRCVSRSDDRCSASVPHNRAPRGGRRRPHASRTFFVQIVRVGPAIEFGASWREERAHVRGLGYQALHLHSASRATSALSASKMLTTVLVSF